jgi:hypothetical protein
LSGVRGGALRYKPEGRGLDRAIGNFHWLNHSGRNVIFETTQPLTEMCNARVFPGNKDGRCVRLTSLLPSCADCLEILRLSTSRSHKSLSRPV